MFYVGVDYSISCPSICIHAGNDWSIDNCSFFYLMGKKKFEMESPFSGRLLPTFSCTEERWYGISQWALNSITTIFRHPDFVTNKQILINLEGYSFGSKGLLCNIGEYTGCFKQALFHSNLTYQEPTPPKSLKKWATGNGNADKSMMYDKFFEETKLDLEKIVGSTKDSSPISDMVDSYFLSKLCHEKYFVETQK